jgi:hypothetical protein
MLAAMRLWLVKACASGFCLFWLACGRAPIEIIGALPDGAGAHLDGAGTPPDAGETPPDAAALPDATTIAKPCPTNLADRVTRHTIPVDKDIAWLKPGGFPRTRSPTDAASAKSESEYYPGFERVALALQNDGQAYIAWPEVNATKGADGSQQPPLGIRVTPLDANFVRRGDDTILPTALEVSGLVAHDDGFTILTRDQNPGSAIDLGDGNMVAFLGRYQNGKQQWSVPLTGSTSEDAAETRTLYSPRVEGELVWTGTTYGAYFVVRGGLGDPQQGTWRDALVFRDGQGHPGPWPVAHGCVANSSLRLIADPGKASVSTTGSIPEVTGICVQQAKQAIKFTSLDLDRVVSDQELVSSSYSGARMGSLLKIPGGYLVFWMSLGQTNDHQGQDIRMARLDSNFNLMSGPAWFRRTPGSAELNLHVMPYGENRFLMVYLEIAITSAFSSDNVLYLGNLVGTHLTLIDVDGKIISDEVVQGIPTPVNSEPVVLPNEDIAWPFVHPSPDYNQVIQENNGPGQTELHVAQIRYCEP